MAVWEELEEYLFEHDKDGTTFSVNEYAADQGIEVAEASQHVGAYVNAQRSKKSRTLYVLHRVPGTRTRNARWAVGVKVKDAKAVGAAFYDDVRVKAINAFAPDLIKIGTVNPRARTQVEAQIDAVINGALVLLKAAVAGGLSSDN